MSVRALIYFVEPLEVGSARAAVSRRRRSVSPGRSPKPDEPVPEVKFTKLLMDSPSMGLADAKHATDGLLAGDSLFLDFQTHLRGRLRTANNGT
jgi:hypothetical protein